MRAAGAILLGLAIASLGGASLADNPTYVWADGLFGGKGVPVSSYAWSCTNGTGATRPGACRRRGGTRLEIVRRADAYSHEFVEALHAGRTFRTLTLDILDGFPPRGTALTVAGARITSDSIDNKGSERISVAFDSISDVGLFWDEGRRPPTGPQVPLAIRTYTPPTASGRGEAP